MACPLLDLTKKDHQWDWTTETQAFFNNLKRLFLSKPVLQLPDFAKPFAIATDALKYALGAILL